MWLGLLGGGAEHKDVEFPRQVGPGRHVWKLGFKCNRKTLEGGLSFTLVSLAALWRTNHRKAGVEVGEQVLGY